MGKVGVTQAKTGEDGVFSTRGTVDRNMLTYKGIDGVKFIEDFKVPRSLPGTIEVIGDFVVETSEGWR